MSQPGPKTGPEMAHLEKVSLSPEGPRPAGRLMLLVMMRYYRFGKGRIFPSEQRLSSDTGMTVRSVQRVLQELERDGWIRRHIHGARGQGWRRYEYELAWPRGYDPQANAWLTEVGRRKAAGRKAFREEHGWQPEATPDSKPQRLEEFLADYWEGQAAESPPEPSPPPDQTPVSEVFDYWRAVMEKPEALLDSTRSKAIAARLKQGYSVDQLKRAIDGCKASAFHQGRNDNRQVYNDIELICRDTKRVESFISIVEGKTADQQMLDNWITGGGTIIEGQCRRESSAERFHRLNSMSFEELLNQAPPGERVISGEVVPDESVVDPDPPQLPPPVLDLAPPLPGIDPAAWERLILHWRHREFHVTREQAAEVARRVQRHPQQVALIHQVIDRNLSEHWPG